MMIRWISILLTLFVTTAAAGGAQDCQEASPEVDTGETPVGQYYVDNEPCQPDCFFSIWIYKESNGQDGLQRGDEVCNDSGQCCDGDAIVL